MTRSLTTQIEAKVSEFAVNFICEHHPSQCNGDCKNTEKKFLHSDLTEIAEVAQEKGYHKGFEDGAEFERVKFGQSNQEGV